MLVLLLFTGDYPSNVPLYHLAKIRLVKRKQGSQGMWVCSYSSKQRIASVTSIATVATIG